VEIIVVAFLWMSTEQGDWFGV